MNDLQYADKKNIWHPFTPLVGADNPVLIESASGIYLHTHDGRKIIDGVSSWWVNIHGHAHPDIASALAKQATTMEHVIFAGFTHAPAILLSQNLLSILPENQAKIFFSDNGSTAVEVGLKMAMQYWHNRGIEKKFVVALQGAYHGDTFGAMSVGERGIFTKPFAPWLFQTLFADFPGPETEEKAFEEFKNLVDQYDVGVFIFEPLIQAAGGMRIYRAEILDRMIAYAHQKNIICVADEVFTGFGRTGKTFACDYLKNKPDIIALSKGLTGGTMPLGVTTCSQKIISAFETDDLLKTFFHGHSYTANPLACAVANASYALLMKKECREQIAAISKKQSEFKQYLQGHKKIRDIRSLGTLLAIELKTEGESSYANVERKKIYNFFLENNILLRPLGNTVYILPPYVITLEELGYIHKTIEKFLRIY